VPTITLETLQEQLNTLYEQRNQAVASLNAVEGAIQLCQHLLSELGKNNESEQETTNGIESGHSDEEGTGSRGAAGVDAQDGSENRADTGTGRSKATAQTKSKAKAAS